MRVYRVHAHGLDVHADYKMRFLIRREETTLAVLSVGSDMVYVSKLNSNLVFEVSKDDVLLKDKIEAVMTLVTCESPNRWVPNSTMSIQSVETGETFPMGGLYDYNLVLALLTCRVLSHPTPSLGSHPLH